MKLTFLGTGTSVGVPMIGCRCAVCRSADPHDRRLRCSALLEIDGKRLLIDPGPDFRQQALLHDISHLDAVLVTHHHYDHLYGLDDVRPLGSVDVYGEKRVLETILVTMPYCFGEHKYPGSPTINLHETHAGQPFRAAGIDILPLRVQHGQLPIVGFRIGDLAYITDASGLPEETFEALKGVQTFVLNALRITPHPSHFSLEESLVVARRIGAKETYFIHFSHDIGLQTKVEPTLPEGVKMAYDGLEVVL